MILWKERVVQDALSLLTPERIDEIATIAALASEEDVAKSTNIPAIKDKLHETQISLDNLTKAIESGLAPEALVKRMVELEKEQKSLESELRKEEKSTPVLQKAQVVYWLYKFKDGDINDPDFRKLLIEMLVDHVTVWDEEDDMMKISIAYNLTSIETKTYHLKTGGISSDLEPNA